MLEFVPLVGLGDDVRPQALGRVERVRHRHHVGRVGLRQLVHEIDDSGQLVDRIGNLVVRDPEPRQHRDMLYLILVQ